MSETGQTEVPSALQIIEDSLDQFTTTDFIERDWGEIAAQSVKDALEQAGFKIVRDDEDAELTRLQQSNAALVERCAKLVEGDIYEDRYRKWPEISTDGNRANDSDVVKHCDKLAAIIRALAQSAERT